MNKKGHNFSVDRRNVLFDVPKQSPVAHIAAFSYCQSLICSVWVEMSDTVLAL